MRKIILPVIILIVFSIKPFKGLAQVTVQDSIALVNLYDSTGGPNWINHANWLTSAPVSTWYGVNVNAGRVSNYL